MNIQHHVKSAILVATLAFSCGAMQTSFANSQGYQVINVATWDALNMRSGAGTGFDIIGSIPANTNGITLTNDESDIGGSIWVKIIWNGQTGWVNKRYLTIATAAVTADNNTQMASSGANQHTHPANRCTGSKSHSHMAPAGHTHSYSCENNNQQSSVRTIPLQNIKQNYYNPSTTDIYGRQYGNQKVAFTNNSNKHNHPANECTSSKTHNHANGSVKHTHRYSCQGRGRSNQQVAQQRPTYYGTSNNLQHTHGRSQCVSAIGHSHKNGDTIHRHECPASVRSSATGGRHTHPANSMTHARTHAHPYQDSRHSHSYGRR
ncbi:MAG: SH3 domain-containing protein [Cocleimonas sp.]|nr:SH3 domain-containing protein [Cocleimonas sp.]